MYSDKLVYLSDDTAVKEVLLVIDAPLNGGSLFVVVINTAAEVQLQGVALAGAVHNRTRSENRQMMLKLEHVFHRANDTWLQETCSSFEHEHTQRADGSIIRLCCR